MINTSIKRVGIGKITAALLAMLIVMGCIVHSASAMEQTRIVVLPFYSEEGRDARDSYADQHYRRMMRFINNQLVRSGFEVLNPFATDSSEREYNRVMERAREDSPLAVVEMCKRYGTDAAYVVWLSIGKEITADGYCKIHARLDGEGYDSGGRDLGVGVSKTFKVTRRDCADAIAEAEKEVGDIVGRTLTAWNDERGTSSTEVVGSDNSAQQSGALQNNINALANTINIRLDGASQYELTEVFGKVVNTVTGVVEAKRTQSRILPDNPQGSWVTWRTKTEGTEPFRLQANIMKMVDDILQAGGDITLKGVPYRYTAAELALLKGLRPGDATSRELQFVVDRELVRDREFSGKYEKKKGFE